MIHPAACLLFLLLAAVSGAQPDAISVEGEQRLAAEVHGIFRAKCADCHGSHLPRPKGKFGYVLDLQRVADNPDYVVRGEPDASELYQLIKSNEMPGEDAEVPALTSEEKESVRRWVEIGAPPEIGEAAKIGDPAPPVETPKITAPIWKRVFRWVGQFHPLSTHFPVALMFVAVFAEVIAWITKEKSWFHTARFLVIIAAVSAVAAVPLGWMNAYFSSYSKETGALLWWHRWLGTGTGVWAVLCAATALAGSCNEGSRERLRFRGALIVGALLMGVTGFLGSALVYGLDHYTWK